jgi:copper transport outer membrane protein MctB
MGQLRVLAGEPLRVIDFRYHLVSLIAVFLAVALGIVIGTTQLNGPLTTNLQSQVSGLQADKRALETQTQQLQSQLNAAGGFDEAVGPTLVAGTLTGRKVVLVIDNSDVPADVVEGVTALLGTAGATVTGTVRLTAAYSDPQAASGLQTYLTGPGMPPGLTLPETDDTGELVASVLGQVLMLPGTASSGTGDGGSGGTGTGGTGSGTGGSGTGGTGTGTAPSQSATSSVLAGLEELKILSSETSSVSPADFAVVLTSGAVTQPDAADRNAALLQLATALDEHGSGVVVAGDVESLADGGLVAAVRADSTAPSDISTVDNVDTAAGRVTTVLALAAEGRGDSGAYGSGKKTQPVPPPAS